MTYLTKNLLVNFANSFNRLIFDGNFAINGSFYSDIFSVIKNPLMDALYTVKEKNVSVKI